MTNLPQVMARYKGGDPTQPKFTRSATIDELMVEVTKSIPVDEVYFVVPHPDGKGFSLRQAGSITLDIKSGLLPEAPAPSLSPSIADLAYPQTIANPSPLEAPLDPYPVSPLTTESTEAQPPLKRPSTAKFKAKAKKSGLVSQGTTKVTGFQKATPAQEEAASVNCKI